MENESRNIGKNIGILCRQLNIYLNHELEKYDITASEIMYLGSLFMHDGVSQEELVREFCVDKAAVARTIGSLENKGLVERRNHENDKRSKKVFLTDAAGKYRDILESLQEKWYAETIGNKDSESVSEFAKILEMISDNTRKLNEKNKEQ